MSFNILSYKATVYQEWQSGWTMYFDSDTYVDDKVIRLSASSAHWPSKWSSLTITLLPVEPSNRKGGKRLKRFTNRKLKLSVSETRWEIQSKILYKISLLVRCLPPDFFNPLLEAIGNREIVSQKRWKALEEIVDKKLIGSIGSVFGLEAFSVGDRVQQGIYDPFTISQIASHANGGALVSGNFGVAWWDRQLGYPQDLSLWSDRQRQFIQSKGVQINGI